MPPENPTKQVKQTQTQIYMEKDFDLLVAMRKDLFAAYRDVCSKPCPKQYTAWFRTVRHPAKRFYLNPDKLRVIVAPMMRGDFTNYEKIKFEHTKRKYRDLYKICMELVQLPEYHDAPFMRVAEKAVTMPAPEFYTTPETFRQIYRYCKRFGINYYPHKAKRICKAYTNHKDGKPNDSVYNGKLKAFAKL